MNEVINSWVMLGVWVVGGTLFMLGLFAVSAIIVTKIGREGLIGKAIIIIFSLLNFLYNLTLGSILCLELPHRLGEPATERMKRYKKLHTKQSRGIRGWRRWLADHVCAFLNLFDPHHC